MTGRLINADALLLALKGERDERLFLRQIAAEREDTEAMAIDDVYLDALNFAINQVELRASRVAA